MPQHNTARLCHSLYMSANMLLHVEAGWGVLALEAYGILCVVQGPPAAGPGHFSNLV